MTRVDEDHAETWSTLPSPVRAAVVAIAILAAAIAALACVIS